MFCTIEQRENRLHFASCRYCRCFDHLSSSPSSNFMVKQTSYRHLQTGGDAVNALYAACATFHKCQIYIVREGAINNYQIGFFVYATLPSSCWQSIISRSRNKSLWLRCFLSDRSEGGQETVPIWLLLWHIWFLLDTSSLNFLLQPGVLQQWLQDLFCQCYGREIFTFSCSFRSLQLSDPSALIQIFPDVLASAVISLWNDYKLLWTNLCVHYKWRINVLS